ncbi:MAG: GNAT family N-acetyltransferase [Pleomorphochaeta sp.]
MNTIREFEEKDIFQMIEIWNQIVEQGDSFPQKEILNFESAKLFFFEQTFTGVFERDNQILGLYILHPNNIGRCNHIANASYAVLESERGNHIGEKLIQHSKKMAVKNGFHILQFNAVTITNTGALYLYKKLGFLQLGVIPGGFLSKENKYIDIIPHYIELI